MSMKFFKTASAAAALTAAVAAQITGPSTATAPTVLPNASLPTGSVSTVSLLTVGDSIGGYRMVGLPDGMGGFLSGTGDTTVSSIVLPGSSTLTKNDAGTATFSGPYLATGAMPPTDTYCPA